MSLYVRITPDSRIVVIFVFFFQAEDGIRDLVRSRGLGDVYKRQLHYIVSVHPKRSHLPEYKRLAGLKAEIQIRSVLPVSYTHLTLPTSDLV